MIKKNSPKKFVLGLHSEYTVKYNPLPSGVPSGTPSGKGLYLTVYPLSNTDILKLEDMAGHTVSTNK